MAEDLTCALLSNDHNDNGNSTTRRYESDDNSLMSFGYGNQIEIEMNVNESKKQSANSSYPKPTTYISFSPFPVLDLLIYYFGTWSYRQHGRICNYFVSVIIFILLWQTMILDIVGVFDDAKSYRFSLEIVTVICLYLRTIFRLYYFSRFAPVWMRKNSYFQQFEKNQNIYKTNIKMSRFLVRISILIISLLFIIKHIYKYYIDKEYQDPLTKYLYISTYPLILWFKDIPICLMFACCYLTCIECCFMIHEYNHDLQLSFKYGDSSSWSRKYKQMYNEIKTRNSGVQFWILSGSLYTLVSLWIYVEILIFPHHTALIKTISKILQEIAEIWMVGLVIYSACLVTISFEKLKTATNELIANYSYDNKQFDKIILKKTERNERNDDGDDNNTSFSELIVGFRKQQNIIELLRLAQLMNVKPCHFTILGLKIGFKGVLQGILIFSLARFMNFIWDDFIDSDLSNIK